MTSPKPAVRTSLLATVLCLGAGWTSPSRMPSPQEGDEVVQLHALATELREIEAERARRLAQHRAEVERLEAQLQTISSDTASLLQERSAASEARLLLRAQLDEAEIASKNAAAFLERAEGPLAALGRACGTSAPLSPDDPQRL